MAIEVDYRFPPGVDPQKQAKIIAIGQTAATWDFRYARWEESFQKHLAKVVSGRIETTGESVATINFPEENGLFRSLYASYTDP